MTLAEALSQARAALSHIEGGARDAKWLTAHALGVPRDRLMLEDTTRELPADTVARLTTLVVKRAKYVPVSHLIGEREFYGRAFYVTSDVLDPRPETEIAVATALEAPFSTVLDIGVGSGAILLTLLAERPEATGTGTDVSIGALAMAEKNARRLGVTRRAHITRATWFEGVEGRFDLIISNPPYIPDDDHKRLGREIRHEPRVALTDGGDGLSAYRAIFAGAAAHLNPGGRVIVEFGAGQGADVYAIAAAAGWTDLRLIPDLDRRDRVLLAKIRELS
ncbi:MAG: peptide chain release factor N(5)-glutamine methyltransferase [Pseudomonadota bacterium]